MKILLSAYHCAPNLGSESAIGWNYAVQLAKLGHKITVVTSDTRKPFFSENEDLLYSEIEVIFYGLPNWIKQFYKPASISEHVYYFFWQIGLAFFTKKLIAEKQIDLIHHITLGVFRVPSYLYNYNIPFVFGPVGGGEECPARLTESLPLKFRLVEGLRTITNIIFSYNPWLYYCLKRSSLILLKTSDNLKYIPATFHYKCKILLELGVSKVSVPFLKSKENKNLKILYAGRLIYWKGVHLGIKAFAKVTEKYPNVQFTIIGSGKDEEWIKEVARQENVYNIINWIPKVNQETLFQMYQNYDFLLFPSLHDSSGGVVLESLAFGLPVVCLDLGGPKEIVNDTCGIVINTKKKTEIELITDISSAIESIIMNPAILSEMSQNATLTAESYTWDKVVERSYKHIYDFMGIEYVNEA